MAENLTQASRSAQSRGAKRCEYEPGITSGIPAIEQIAA